jgi:hypothetical protein
MKIHEYNEMMSYLTRRPMSMGGHKNHKTIFGTICIDLLKQKVEIIDLF